MNCKIYRTDLIGFLRGNLPPEKEARIREHLEGCPECHSFAGYLKSTLELISAEKAIHITPDPFLATRIEGRILNARIPSGQTSVIPKLMPALVFSFFIAMGILGGFGIGKLITSAETGKFHETADISLLMNDLKQEPIEGFLLGY